LPIIEAIEEGRLNAVIKIVISDKPDALILEKARAHNIPAWYVSSQGHSRESYDQMLHQLFIDHHVDLGLLIGFMRILSGKFTKQWPGKLMNVHPSLLPKHGNLMDLSVHEAVLNSGDEETGCTVHMVEEAVDAGAIILQKRCPVSPDDTSLSLKAKVQALEAEALIEAIHMFEQGKI
jgi:phosphoribosylglycinamide formyltransferase-1